MLNPIDRASAYVSVLLKNYQISLEEYPRQSPDCGHAEIVRGVVETVEIGKVNHNG